MRKRLAHWAGTLRRPLGSAKEMNHLDPVADQRRAPPTTQNVLNFMDFFFFLENSAKSYVDTPSCGESWIRPLDHYVFYRSMLGQDNRFFGKFGKIVCWRPPPGWRPLLRGILDLPLRPLCILQIHVRTRYHQVLQN